MGDILKKLDRDMVLNFCQYGMGDVWQWGREADGHSWRTAGDLGGGFEQFPSTCSATASICMAATSCRSSAAPALERSRLPAAGLPLRTGKGKTAPTPLTPNEQYAHVSLWCLVAAPLIFSGDITRLDDFTLSLLTNDEVIEVDQDPLGKAALRVAKAGDLEVWAKDMEDGRKAVGLFNRGECEADRDRQMGGPRPQGQTDRPRPVAAAGPGHFRRAVLRRRSAGTAWCW